MDRLLFCVSKNNFHPHTQNFPDKTINQLIDDDDEIYEKPQQQHLFSQRILSNL